MNTVQIKSRIAAEKIADELDGKITIEPNYGGKLVNDLYGDKTKPLYYEVSREEKFSDWEILKIGRIIGRNEK